MKTFMLVVLLPLTAFAGSKGALRALEELQDTVSDSEAECSKKLGKKLDALAGDLDDGLQGRKLRAQVQEVRDFAEDRCPRKLAGKVSRALETVTEGLADEGRPRRKSRDDDEEEREAEAPKRREGPVPMDAITFRGLVSSLQANPNEYLKLDLIKNTVGSQYLTAQQLGPVLEQFHNDYLRLDAAKAIVPRLVDPQHALVHSTKFNNSYLAADFSRLLTK